MECLVSSMVKGRHMPVKRGLIAAEAGRSLRRQARPRRLANGNLPSRYCCRRAPTDVNTRAYPFGAYMYVANVFLDDLTILSTENDRRSGRDDDDRRAPCHGPLANSSLGLSFPSDARRAPLVLPRHLCAESRLGRFSHVDVVVRTYAGSCVWCNAKGNLQFM